MASSSAESPVPKYEYETLPSLKCIRLLEITYHSAGSGEFEGKLHTTDLEQNDHLPYTALSYTWKLPETAADPVERPAAPAVVVDGRRLAIGNILFDFLEQAMDDPDKPELPGMLWIDAVCINQEDLTERSTQVAFMRDIYHLAGGVVVWLGRHDVHSRLAIPLIASFAEVDIEEVVKVNLLHCQPLTDPEFYEHNNMKPLSLADWNHIRSFHSRSWFHRLWTMQEVLVTENPMLLCGETDLDWNAMTLFILVVILRGWGNTLQVNQFLETWRIESGVGLVLTMGSIYHEKFTISPHVDRSSQLLFELFEYKDLDSFICAKLAWILQMGRCRKTTDQRDRIFGPQGLVSQYYKPGDWDLLKPDYAMTVEDVFTQATRYILQKLKNLSILSCVEDKSYRAHPDLPSWVPDFSKLLRPVQLSITRSYNASHGIEVLFTCHDNDAFTFRADGYALSICGVKVDVLDSLSGDFEFSLQQHKVSTLLEVTAQVPLIYHNEETRGKILMETLIARASIPCVWLNPDHSPTVEELQHAFSQFLKMNLAFEIWDWNSSHSPPSMNWWDEHKNLEELCNQELLLPSRTEVEEYFVFFSALFPASQDPKTKKIIDDPEFLEKIWDPQVPYLDQLKFTCAARSLWVSKEKYIGLAPRSARQGDEVWIVHGSKTPLVLRNQPDGFYQFLGEAYTHGLMVGEFFKRGNKDLVIGNVVLK